MTIIGIDLGTTNSSCSYWSDKTNDVELIPNRLNEFLTPSVVGFDDNQKIVIGKIAKERLYLHSDSTVAVFKRLMGTSHRITLGNQEFTATELSSLLLRSLKEDAEQFLGEQITEAVISVPAYFNDNQRHATKIAGELAGLKIQRLINEPTSAALAYGLHQQKEGTYIILDMGGGTFDVSILEFFEGIMEVHASAGDNYLSGEDFVNEMIKDVLNSCHMDKSSVSNQEFLQLHDTLEKIKKKIDQFDGEKISIVLAGKIYDITITKEWFQKISNNLLLRVKIPIERALSDANLNTNDIKDVILVGGSTRLSLFRNLITRLFGKFPSTGIDPDLVVAMGAGVQAALMSKNKALDDIVLTDVCPYTLGTEVNGSSENTGGYFLPIIERNSIVPVSIEKYVQTSMDNQTHVEINIYQGESRFVNKNIYLGSILLKVPKNKAGKELICIRYSYDMSGLLEVDVTILSTGKTFFKSIENAPSKLNKDQREKSHQKLSVLKLHPRENEENKFILARGEKLYEQSIGEKREYIANLMSKYDHILEKQQPLEIKKENAEIIKIFNQLDAEEWF